MLVRRTAAMKLILFCALACGLPLAAANDYGSCRQYYSGWNKHPTANYHFRHYYYKPTTTYTGYKHHYVVYFPSRPKHFYFYNPYKKQYWGRCEVEYGGHAQYSLLKEQDRRGTVREIPESAFPPPSDLPPIPESRDNVPLDLPPDDLPSLDSAFAPAPSGE